jgi:hypothetical protein
MGIFSQIKWWIYAIIAGVLFALAAAWYAQVAGLNAEVSDAKAKATAAEAALDKRITSEATAIAEAVKKARNDDQLKLDSQRKKLNELIQQTKASIVVTDATRQRLFDAARVSNACNPSEPDVPNPASAALADNGQGNDGLRPADRKLIERLLQIGSSANETERQRKFLIDQYETNCRK